jgi:flavin reductase (DIM6/NTAB) family NADH-FMN oxidoreductase RutF
MEATSIDLCERSFRHALGSFATGVTILSGRHPGFDTAMGATLNSFGSVSLQPRLVLFSLRRQSACLPCFGIGQPFAISVLSARQSQLANHFAAPHADKWASVDSISWETGCPIVADAIAAFEGHVHSQCEAGDHVVIFGHVDRFDIDRSQDPLVFVRGAYASVRAGNEH